MVGKVYFENLGCAKNQVDAEVMACRLEKKGWTVVQEADGADLIIVNTCGFIESAKKESVDTFFSLRNNHPDARIVVSGCLAQRYASQLEEQLPEADAVFGNRDLGLIDSVVDSLEKKETAKPVRLTPPYPDPDNEFDRRSRLFGYPGSAFVKISEGCNHRCGYCAIPLIRGDLRSRPESAILSEMRRLADSGIKEMNVVAQDLAAYGFDREGKSTFDSLLKKMNGVEGDFVIRMLYIHPDWMTDRILDTVKDCKKVLHYFDIPFQHASEHILRPMRRTGDIESYVALVRRIREAIPDAVIRTTLMLGFPGDNEQDFETLLSFVRSCRFTWMGSFLYSREEDTPAWEMTTEKEHKALAKKAAKWQKKLEKVQQDITASELTRFVGNTYKVLIEEVLEGQDMAIGRIYAQAPDVDGLTVVNGSGMKGGSVYDCRIVRVNGVDLEAVKV